MLDTLKELEGVVFRSVFEPKPEAVRLFEIVLQALAQHARGKLNSVQKAVPSPKNSWLPGPKRTGKNVPVRNQTPGKK
jgi:hypothetical protein